MNKKYKPDECSKMSTQKRVKPKNNNIETYTVTANIDYTC